MRRVGVAVMLASLLVAPSGGDFLQWGSDAQRTGVVEGGPIFLDHAFAIDLQVPRAYQAPPLILGDEVFILTRVSDEQVGTQEVIADDGTVGIWRIGLDNASAERIVPLAPADVAETWAADGDRIFVVYAGTLAAYGRSGESLWSRVLPMPDGQAAGSASCLPAAIDGSELILGCALFLPGPPAVASSPWLHSGQVSAVLGFDLATGEPKRAWYQQDLDDTGGPAVPASSRATSVAQTSMVISNGTVYLLTIEPATAPSLNQCNGLPSGADDVEATGRLRAIGPDGTLQWTRALRLGSPSAQASGETSLGIAGGTLMADGLRLLLVDGSVRSIERHDGCVAWETSMEDDSADQGGIGAIMSEGYVIASGERLWPINRDGGEGAWPSVVHQRVSETSGFLVDVRFVYSATQEATVAAHRVTDGSLVWQERITATLNSAPQFGVGGGVFVTVDAMSHVRVYGSAGAGITVDVGAANLYPEYGEEFVLDLGGSIPGVQAADIEFQVDWGDGHVSSWSDGTVWSHIYEAQESEPASLAATVFARNSAGQEARRVFTVYAGLPAPLEAEEQGFFQRALDPDNQDVTFFIIGAAFTVVGALWAAWRLSRKRRRLRSEVHALHDIEADASQDPGGALEALQAFSDRAADLLERQRIDQSHYHVLRDRIQAVERRLN